MAMKNKISVLGVPMWLGQTRYGTNLGPNAIRAMGLLDCLASICKDVDDRGNVGVGSVRRDQPRNLKNLRSIIAGSSKLAARVSEIVANKRFPLVLGGDHSIAIGTLAGIARHYNRLGVIWFDAHADINTAETTPSGNIHGMPLAASMGLGHPELVRIGGYVQKVNAENIVMIGIRDIDPGEAELIRSHNIKVYTMQNVRELGIQTIINETIDYLSSRCDGIHLSFDLDGLDPLVTPGVGTPVAGGISYQDTLTAMRLLAAADVITSAEVVELNPILDRENKTTIAAISMVYALLGGTEKLITWHDSQQPAELVL